MKKPTLIILLLTISLSVKAQVSFFGKYKFYTNNVETCSLFLNCNNTFLMEDTMLVTKDSSITTIVKGTWKIQKNKNLTFFVDSIISKATVISNSVKIQYLIKDGKFYLRVLNKKQYIRENKKFEKQFPTCLPGMREDYETYKARQNNRYFFKVVDFNCDQE